MKTDYQKLCLDLFGTDDVKELKEISQKLSKKLVKLAFLSIQ